PLGTLGRGGRPARSCTEDTGDPTARPLVTADGVLAACARFLSESHNHSSQKLPLVAIGVLDSLGNPHISRVRAGVGHSKGGSSFIEPEVRPRYRPGRPTRPRDPDARG